MASSTLFLTLTAALSALQCVVGQAVLSGNASAVIYAAQGYGEERNMLGVLRIQQFVETLSNGTVIRYVNITGRIQSVFPGNNNHGIHIHEKLASRSTEGCSGLGKHFNPKGVVHGPQSGNATTRHIGDLGNVRSDSSGSVNIEIRDTIIQVG